MRARRGRRSGFGLNEVLVAVAIVAVNAVGWMATLQVVLSLARRVGELVNGVDPTVVAGAVCGLGCLVPRTAPSCLVREASHNTMQCGGRRRGVSLVELLVSLAVGAIVLAGVATTIAITDRAARGVTQMLDASTLRVALPALLSDLVETAGRGMPIECGLSTAVGSSRLSVRRALEDGTVVDDEVFAGIDGGGRPALYLRRVPHARQPWVEDVTAFTVVRIVFVAGYGDEPSRAERLTARIAHPALDEVLDVDIALPHLPCLEPAT